MKEMDAILQGQSWIVMILLFILLRISKQNKTNENREMRFKLLPEIQNGDNFLTISMVFTISLILICVWFILLSKIDR